MTDNEIMVAIYGFMLGWFLANQVSAWAKSRIPKDFTAIVGELLVTNVAKVRKHSSFCGEGFYVSQSSKWKRDGEVDVFVVVTTKDPQP